MSVRPAFSSSVWRSISNASARCTERSEFMFFTSTFVPNSIVPFGRIEIFASQRSFFESHVGHSEGEEQRAEFGEVRRCFVRLSKVCFGNDLNEWDPGAVVVDQGMFGVTD